MFSQSINQLTTSHPIDRLIDVNQLQWSV